MYHILLSLFTVIVACIPGFGQTTDVLQLEGHILNSPKQRIYLNNIAYDEVNVASAQLDGVTNRFYIEAPVAEEGIYVLRFEKKGPDTEFVFSKGKVKLFVDYKLAVSPRKFRENMRLEGSPASIEYGQVERMNSFLGVKHFGIKKEIDSLSNLYPVDHPLVEEKKNQFNAVVGERVKFLKNTAIHSASPVCAATGASYLRYWDQLDTTLNFRELVDSLYSLIAKRFPSSSFVKMVVEGYQTSRKWKEHGAATVLKKDQFAPDIILPDLNDQSTSLNEFKGKYVLIDFWASWCQPCRQESPYLVRAFQQFEDKNFTIFSVSIDTDKEKWRKAIDKDQLTPWTHVIDQAGGKSKVALQYGVQAIPANFLIDPTGKIIAVNLRGEDLIKNLQKLLVE